MASLNRAQLIGNVGQEPEIKTLSSGARVANFSLATTEKWKDKSSGEMRERTEWHRVTVWNDGLIGVIEKYVRKGSKLFVEGQIQTRKYEKNGADHYATEIVLQGFGGQLILLGDRKQDEGGGGYERQAQQRRAAPVTADLDDEIPF